MDNKEVDIFSKGYYTNSFHIDVDSRLPGYKKIQLEGLFHEICSSKIKWVDNMEMKLNLNQLNLISIMH